MALATRLMPFALTLTVAGCGLSAAPAPTVRTSSVNPAAPELALSMDLQAPSAKADEKTLMDPVIRPIAITPDQGPEQELRSAFDAFAGSARQAFGADKPLLDLDEVPAGATVSDLDSEGSLLPGFSVQAKPETTQARADREAYAWAYDAKMLYVGWGFSGRSSLWQFLGQSRHVYYSASKQRLLYLDYNFFRMKKSVWQSRDIVLEYGGKIISFFLNEPRGEFPFNGREAYNEATRMGYSYGNRTYATIKGVCLQPLLVGPSWFYMDVTGKPTVMVDAVTGESRMSHWLMDVVKIIFSISR
ncbi:MAG: hypothetical protein FJY99_06680 [Candidatus Sericytochromatia bacterium]|nr:hypothetical protein [Candidatus Tanganyikabacteria bacterium]